MDLLATLLAATVAIDLFAALSLAFAFARRSVERYYALASLAAVGAAVHAAALLFTLRPSTSPLMPAAVWIAPSGLALALPLTVHFAMVYLGRRAPWYLLAAGYAGAAGVGLLASTHVPLPHWAHGAEHGAAGLASRAIIAGPASMAVDLLDIAAAVAVLVLLARAYLTGRRGALGMVVGATVLLATTLYDLGVGSGAFATPSLADHGMVALVMGIAMAPAARYAQVSLDLQLLTDELRTRSRELRVSQEELRAAKEELDKKEQLAVVGELAAVIAHEVRNPLAIISNAVAGLRKPVITRGDHEVLLSILDEEANRLNRLVTDLLRYARPVNVQRSHVALEDVIERALALANTDAKTIRMELEMEVSESRLWGDANLLRQVFDNLIDNALQAMSGVGSLTIRVRAATQGGVDGFAVDIIDTGEGMDTQVRSRALDPFFTTRPSGTGLGLAIVDRIVDAHGGHVSIRSRSGEGTTVTVFLPHTSPNDPPASPRIRSRGVSDVSP
ncbi:MAG TPA: ATP-binding protein [Polyangiaceae bacterium]|nr:ATP-binding protein [Polyangiaceae bacterium]